MIYFLTPFLEYVTVVNKCVIHTFQHSYSLLFETQHGPLVSHVLALIFILFSAVLGLLAALRLCLVAATGSYSLVPVSARASHCPGFFVEHVRGCWCTGFNSCSTWA